MTDFLTNLREAGPLIVITVAVLIGAAREWWVWGYIYRREIAEKEYWRDKALTHLGLAEKTTKVVSDSLIEEAS